jgi:hypothetical protein
VGRKSSSQQYGSVSDLFGRDGLGSVLSAFMQGVDTVAGPQKRVIQQVTEFFGHFSRSAVERFSPMLARPTRCSMAGCQAEAVAQCMGCGDPACMAHLHVSHRAEGVCDQCVRDLMELKGKQCRPPSGRDATAQEVRKALRTLGVRSGATWAEVQRAHRRAAAENHPDRVRTHAQKRKAEDKSKRINAAFELLRRHYERQAA